MAREFTCERARDDGGESFQRLGIRRARDSPASRNAIRFTLVAHPDSTWMKPRQGCRESAPAFP
jgi:hypothetical protein